jgi:predicted N-acetyltransferase YhbS
MAFRIEHLAACPEHLARVAAWQHTEFGYLNPAICLEQREERLRESLSATGLPLTMVAVSDDGDPVGAATLLPRTITHPHLTPWLSTVVVPPASRGRGIASALSLRLALEAGRFGFPAIYLFTPRNESLYRHAGWTTIETADVNGTPVAIMARPTTSSIRIQGSC